MDSPRKKLSFGARLSPSVANGRSPPSPDAVIEYCNNLLEKALEKEAPTGRGRTPHEVLAWARSGGRTSAGETADACGTSAGETDDAALLDLQTEQSGQPVRPCLSVSS
jgi:hypothetical protein